jgi:hypothetical protein
MSRFELVRADDGAPITVGDTVTVRGVACTVTELEAPEPDFCGCVHLTSGGKESTCAAEDIDAQWFYEGQPYRPEPYDDREDFDSGRWTQADTDSMEAGRDLPLRNEAGEWL